jgi:hypothetical protein
MRHAVLPIVVLLAGCEPADQAIDRGYHDGYAAGASACLSERKAD